MAKQEDIAAVAANWPISRGLSSRWRTSSVRFGSARTRSRSIDLAAKELAEVSTRLQAAANALRESI